MTKAAVQALPDEVPEFFRDGKRMIAHCSYDPDISKNRGAPHVNIAEHPEHYLDLELLQGKPLPKKPIMSLLSCAPNWGLNPTRWDLCLTRSLNGQSALPWHLLSTENGPIILLFRVNA